MAVRGALGAGKRRMVRQFLTESLLLSTAGALLGIGIAAFALVIFQQTIERNLLQAQSIHLNPTVMVILVGFTILTSLLFGIFPAILASRTPIAEMLKSGGTTSSGNRGQASLRNTLLIGEVAISIVLLVGAGLMLRTVSALRHVPLGFRADHLVLVNFTVPNWHYKNRNLNAVLWDPLLEHLRSLPGVEGAALSSVMPIGHDREIMVDLDHQNWTDRHVRAVVRAASPGLSSVLGMRLHAGRFFTAQDTLGSPHVMVVTQGFVSNYMRGKSPVGKLIQLGNPIGTATIVGVLDDVREDSVAAPSQPASNLLKHGAINARQNFVDGIDWPVHGIGSPHADKAGCNDYGASRCNSSRES